MDTQEQKYDEAVRVFAGFDPRTWNELSDGVKQQFYDIYDEADHVNEE